MVVVHHYGHMVPVRTVADVPLCRLPIVQGQGSLG
jgi:hypothetical protein